MRRIPFLPALIIALIFSVQVQAQPTASPVSSGPSPADPAAAAAPSADQEAARALAEILQDDSAREALIRRLLATAEAPGAPVPDTATVAAEPVSLARKIAEYTRDVAEDGTEFITEIGASAADVLGVFVGAQRVNWAALQDAAVSLALVATITLGLYFTLRAVGRRIFDLLADRAGPDRLAADRTPADRPASSGPTAPRGAVRAWLVAALRLIATSLIDAAILVLAWAGGHAVALYLGDGAMDFRQSLFLNAFLLVEMSKVVLRAGFSPRHGRLRLAPMGDETAVYWYFWTSRLVSLLGYGTMLAVPIVNATVSFGVGRSLTLLLAVTALLVAILVILQNRAPIRAALRARRERDPDDVVGRAVAALGAVWHLIAIAYLVALFAIWSAQPGDALEFMLLATFNSVVALLAGMAAMVLISRAIAGGMHLPDDIKRKLPLLEDRLNAFVPAILGVARVLVALAVLISVAQSWQVMDFLGWLASEVGRDVAARGVSAALVIVIAMLIWLAMSSFVEYRLNPENGSVATARTRTLLSLFRNALTIALVVIAVMLTLSELGVNIAPLLAGAGVLGLAIGFGAQKLVQDIITGAFIQVENAMNEGDVVTAAGTTGVVERLTIRSVGLRDVQGTYHLIPFSSVDMVSNFMKGFAYHVADVGVAYRENVAEVKDLMREAFDRLRAGEHGFQIIGPLEVHGVTELGDSAVVVRARIKTRPGAQWAVGRAWNEVVKDVLDRAGIEIPYPHMTLYMGADKDGAAPALNVRQLGGGGRPAQAAAE